MKSRSVQKQLARTTNSVRKKLAIIFALYVSSASAQGWNLLGLTSESVSAVAIDSKNSNVLYVGSNFYAGTQGGLFKSTNGGAVWDTLVRGLDVAEIVIHPDSSNKIFIATSVSNGLPSGILKSTDNGLNWTRSDSGIFVDAETRVTALAINPKRPEIMYAGTGGFFGGSLYKSTDGGHSWFLPTFVRDANISEIAIEPQRPETLYVGTTGFGAVFVSKNGGTSWDSTLWNVGSIKNINIFSFDPQVIYASRFFRTTKDSTFLFKTTNAGQQWTKIETPFLSLGILSNVISHIESNTIYIGTIENGVYGSTNSGSSWMPLNQGFSDSTYVVLWLSQNEKILYAGTGHGFYKLDLPTSVTEDVPTPQLFFLYPNYPNPFNSATSIRFLIANDDHVTLTVSNLLGQRVAVLLDRWQEAGEQTMTFEPSNLPSGVYFCRLQTGGAFQMRKLVLVR